MLCSMHCLSVCDLLNTACRSNQCQGTHFAPLLPVLDGADVHVTLVVAHPEVHKMKTAVTRLRLVGYSRSSEALLTKQAAALVRGVDLAAGLRNRLHLLLDLHAAASVPVTQQALTLFVNSICLVKVSRPSLLHFITISPHKIVNRQRANNINIDGASGNLPTFTKHSVLPA